MKQTSCKKVDAIKCPACNKISMVFVKGMFRWVCLECGYYLEPINFCEEEGVEHE